MQILKNGFTAEEAKFLKKIGEDSYSNEKGKENSSSDEKENPSPKEKSDPFSKEEVRIEKYWKYNALREEILFLINLLHLPETKHQIINPENHEVINNLVILIYSQFKIFKNESYSKEFFKADSTLSKLCNINVGFKSYYLISRLWNNNDLPSFN